MDEDNAAQRRHTAEVVMYWMRRRGLTRTVFAHRLGKSLSWVDKIRAGDRQLDRLSVLTQIARVLDIPLDVLIHPDTADQRRQCPDAHEIASIRVALRRYDAVTNVFRPNGDTLPEPDLARLERGVRYGWAAFQTANYATIGALLPGLIRDAQAAVWQTDGTPRRTAQTWLAWTYQLTAATALKLGDAQLGWIAADRGIQLAEQTENLTLIGCAARHVAHALFQSHHGRDAITLVRNAADRLQPHLPTNDAGFAAAYGMLLLKGSIAAAQLHHAADVRDLQNEALETAKRLNGNGHNQHWSAFGTTNVLIHRVCALADMHAAGLAIEAAATIDQAALQTLPRERRAAHCLDLARGHLQAGRRDHAANALLDADHLAPGEVRCRQLTKDTISRLLISYPARIQPPTALTQLARTLRITT